MRLVLVQQQGETFALDVEAIRAILPAEDSNTRCQVMFDHSAVHVPLSVEKLYDKITAAYQ